jgi:hypothetical protein
MNWQIKSAVSAPPPDSMSLVIDDGDSRLDFRQSGIPLLSTPQGSRFSRLDLPLTTNAARMLALPVLVGVSCSKDPEISISCVDELRH